MNGLKYWDPSKSMFDEAVSMVQNDPTKLPEGETEVTQENYFRIVSLERLGTEQSAQFQSGNQYGANWHWGSKCTEDNGTITCDDEATPANNALADMAREYNADSTYKYNHYYNWYAATAESGSYSLVGAASDSLCPLGWRLPSASNAVGKKSWWNLVVSYDVLRTVDGNPTDGANNQAASALMRSSPIALSYTGYLQGTATFNMFNYGNQGGYFSDTSFSPQHVYALDFTAGVVNLRGGYGKLTGASVRCVKK